MPAIDAPGGWEARVLAALGAIWDPNTEAGQRNIGFLSAWSKAENTKAAFNPLASTQEMPGATAYNQIGVRNYTSAQQGIDATAQTLSRYPSIVRFLGIGQPQSILTTPAGRSELNKWATGESSPAYSDYINDIAKLYYDEKSADAWAGFGGEIAGAVGDAAGFVGDALTKWVRDLTGWLEGVGAKSLAYVVLTGLALVLIAQGLGQAFGINPIKLAATRGRAGMGAGSQTEEIPF